MTEGFAIVVAILIIAAVLGLAAYQAHLRRKMWEEIAQRYGFRFHHGDPKRILRSEPGFSLFDQGHSKKVERTLEGTWKGRPLLVFDYRYRTGSGKNQQTHTLTAVMAWLPLRAAAHLKIRPEHFGDWLVSAFGFEDIDFEYGEFNRRFHVTCDDKRFAYDICHSGMIEFLMTDDGHCWELLDDRLLFYSRQWKTFDPQEFERALALLDGFLERLPGYLVRS